MKGQLFTQKMKRLIAFSGSMGRGGVKVTKNINSGARRA